MRRAAFVLAALGALSALLVMSSGAGAGPTPRSFLIVAKGNALPTNLSAKVQAAGGTLTNTVPQVGIAVASSANTDFSAKAATLGTVVPNLNLQWVDPARRVEGPGVDFANPPTSGDDDFFFDLQWGHDAVGAIEAWNAGERGAGARVAVLDTGFDIQHPDLVPNIDFGASVDFTGEGLDYALPDPFSHGSHTAGTVAAADNGFGTIGVAPDADLILVKVLSDEGSGSFEDVISGIVYAAGVADADVISMSLGARIPRSGDPLDPEVDTPEEVADLKMAINRATRYADAQGATVIASAGNDAEDYDQNVGILHLPSMADKVLAISATAPIGWAVDPTVSLDNLASYSNYGNSVLDFAAPGGDFVLPGEDPCVVAGLLRPCWVFDLVFSTGNNAWFWSAGTSMAAPHAAGVAAIIIGANGGEMKPKDVERALKNSTDRVGKSKFFGHGRVNAGNAVAP
ncbi:MAG: S8 family serine peptidase [Myxococcota bacterium]